MDNTYEFRPVREGDLPAMLEIRNRSFGPMPASGAQAWGSVNLELIDQGRNYGVFDGDRLVASGKARGFQQWWGGRLVPMAGMAGIVVSPEYRGRGVGTALMRGLVAESLGRGEAISALYPATVPVYRHLGWEFAGSQHRYALNAAVLRTLGGRAPVRRAVPEDAQRLHDLLHQGLQRSRDVGPLQWAPSQWRHEIEDADNYIYLAEDGVVFYGWHGPDLLVHFLWADSEETARTLWAVVGSGSSVAKTAHAYLSPHDPVHWLLPEEAATEVQRHGWMLRLLDVPKALGARGYPPGLRAELHLRVEDRESERNTGDWVLSVAGGAATAERAEATGRAAGSGPDGDVLALTGRGLAALYAGHPVDALRRAGLARGGSAEEDAVVDAVFAGSAAYLTDYF